jgi:hypothetical protein
MLSLQKKICLPAVRRASARQAALSYLVLPIAINHAANNNNAEDPGEIFAPNAPQHAANEPTIPPAEEDEHAA